LSVPYRRGDWLYYSRTIEGLQYPLYCRKQNAGAIQAKSASRFAEAPEQIVLDLNQLAEGKKFMALGAYSISDDGRLLAFSTDETGFRQYTLFVKNLGTGELGPERIEKTGSVAWAAGGRQFFYTVEDSAKRQYRVYRHTLSSDNDTLVFEETDERFRVYVSRTRSREWLFLTSSSHTASEERCLRASDPEGEWQLIAAREGEHKYDVDHHPARGDAQRRRSVSPSHGAIRARRRLAATPRPGFAQR
jgi:oligopeptidase B